MQYIEGLAEWQSCSPQELKDVVEHFSDWAMVASEASLGLFIDVGPLTVYCEAYWLAYWLEYWSDCWVDYWLEYW